MLKVPLTAPDMAALDQEAAEKGWSSASELRQGPVVNGEYIHWDKLARLRVPEGLTHRHWWYLVKSARALMRSEIPLRDRDGRPFGYVVVDPIPEWLHRMDMGSGRRVGMAAQVTNPATRDDYLVASLMEEAITSSQLEGAVTTRQVALDMLRSGRPPSNRSERMIVNNFATMRHIVEWRGKPLTREMVFQIHALVTDGTMSDPTAVGRFRNAEEDIVVGDHEGNIYHHPPAADDLGNRLDAMIRFANGETPDGFLHPALRSILLHFWLSYDHPFVDGNGRAARALFYWSMLRHGYWLFEFISISTILRRGPARYSQAFLHTETDENDLTYFVLYHLDVIRQAIDSLQGYLDRKALEWKAIDAAIDAGGDLNQRQRIMLKQAVRRPDDAWTIANYRRQHGVVYQTARTDLMAMAESGLLKMHKEGNAFHFTPVPDLEERLAGR